MIEVKGVDDKDTKMDITRRIMHALPKWFSPPEDIERKALIHREYPFFAASQNGKVVGFLVLKIHNQFTGDIYNLGVLEEAHRRGVGHQLVQSAEDYLLKKKFRYLTVKTLDSSANYEPYERTRSFYLKEGFIPLEVLTTFWNEENPCLFLVKALGQDLQNEPKC